MWDSPEAFDKAVDNYFNKTEQPTWTGLALHLGFNSRQALNYYMDSKPEFLDSIKKGLSKIEEQYEGIAVYSRTPTGAIFALKNFGWKDKQEIDQKTTIKDERLDLNKLTDDELEVLAEIQRKLGISEA
jgi:hypothetical protein